MNSTNASLPISHDDASEDRSVGVGEYYTTLKPSQLVDALSDVVHETKTVKTKVIKVVKVRKKEPEDENKSPSS